MRQAEKEGIMSTVAILTSRLSLLPVGVGITCLSRKLRVPNVLGLLPAGIVLATALARGPGFFVGEAQR